jgi:hypothetical protein
MSQSPLFRASFLAAVLGPAALVACGGEFDPGGQNGDVVRIPSDDPKDDERLDALDIICESTLLVTGTYEPGDPPPADHKGCWPVGVWTINATIDRLGCDPQVEPMQFKYNITHDDEAGTINVAYMDDPTNERVNLKISTAGDGLCHGNMEHFGTDFAVWGFFPTLQLDGTLSGKGVYTLHKEEPF